MLVVVPRLVGRLIPDPATAPLGAEVWGDTQLILPRTDGKHNYRNLFTGETIDTQDGKVELSLGDILATFPVAVLTVST